MVYIHARGMYLLHIYAVHVSVYTHAGHVRAMEAGVTDVCGALAGCVGSGI